MLQTILSVAVAQFDIYSDKFLSFPHRPFAHIFALKKQDMSDFSFIPPTSVHTILAPTSPLLSPPRHPKSSSRSTTSRQSLSTTRRSTSRGEVTIKCLTTSLISSSLTRQLALARCSTPKSAMAADLSMTQGLPPHKCKRKWMTLCWTTTSQVTSSVCARSSSIIDIVNSIRLAKGNVFAEWKLSDTAKTL